MEVGITELVKHVTKLVEQAEHGEEIVIKRHGKPVAKLAPIEKPRPQRQFGTLKDIVKLQPGWDEDLPLDMWEVLQEPKAKKAKPVRRKA